MKKQTKVIKDAIPVLIPRKDILCLWAAVVLREPEPLTRLLKKLLKPSVLKLLNKK